MDSRRWFGWFAVLAALIFVPTRTASAALSMKLTQPECLQFELLDLVTGEACAKRG